MEFDRLTRSQGDYIWAMEQMIHCPGLSPLEIHTVQHLLSKAYISVNDFDFARRMTMQFHPDVLISIINKCRAAGIGREWPQHAH